MFKLKVDSRQFANLEQKVKAQFQATLADPNLMEEVGTFVRDRVVYQARTRKPLTESGTLPDLTPKWKRRRAALAETNKTHSTYSANRSNLTLTGQLLDSYRFEVKGPGLIELGFSGTHDPYMGKNGPIGKPVLNETIAEGLKAMGYQVLDRSVESNQTILKRIKSIALRYLRRSLRTRVNAR